jgi:uncharacterized protein (TIGR00369 family)
MAQARTTTEQIELNRLIRENRVDDYPSPNLGLGMRPLSFGPGRSQWVWESQPEGAINPFGMVQGGYLAVMVDEMLSTAIGSVLEEGEWAVTAELKLSYLRALVPQRLEGSGRVIRRTRTLAFMDARIRNAAGEPAVIATSTWAISKART